MNIILKNCKTKQTNKQKGSRNYLRCRFNYKKRACAYFTRRFFSYQSFIYSVYCKILRIFWKKKCKRQDTSLQDYRILVKRLTETVVCTLKQTGRFFYCRSSWENEREREGEGFSSLCFHLSHFSFACDDLLSKNSLNKCYLHVMIHKLTKILHVQFDH